MRIQDNYQSTIRFAAEKHGEVNQTVRGTNLPYLLHLSNVAMEILTADKFTKDWDLLFAVQVALLHDLLEDTKTRFTEVETRFGKKIAEAVSALTKNNDLPKQTKVLDSLNRIKLLDKEVWAVKIADRITNLQAPPAHWTLEKRREYLLEAKLISDELRGCNDYLENRLTEKISEYKNYCQ
jgi:guanosine-3',5'-bis(diphosphate) 3'-pyrophosphohydrolase